MVASILAVVGATPAAADSQQADARSEWLACVGAAKMGHGFTDVSMSSVHYDAINCLAHYGITTGKTADTFDPGSSVTRSQMALFLTRAADKAGIDLGDAMDMGFADLGMTGADRVMAINKLAAKGIMPGRTSMTFDPTGLVTRADMAQHLFTLLDLALDSVHIDRLPSSADGDGTGIEVNVSGGNGMRPDDYFGDVRRTQPVGLADMINAVYELGITTGTNGMVGEMGTFEPAAPVTRAQMASFIMRALGHTNLRPAGLTAQQTSNRTQVSVRAADHKPVLDRRVELFSSSYPDDAFDRSGKCITSPSYVMGSVGDVNTSGFDACSIDSGDADTDAMGNVIFEVGSLSGSRFSVTCTGDAPSVNAGTTFRFMGAAGAPATVWAWQGDLGDTVDSRSTDLVEPVAANAANPGRATQATISGGAQNEVKMGRTLTYTIQLRNSRGQPVGPTPGTNSSFVVTITKTSEAAGTTAVGTTREYSQVVFRQTTPRTPDSSGLITISITNPDPTTYAATGTTNDSDVQVSVEVVTAGGNELPLVDRTGGASNDSRAAAGTVGVAPTGDVVRVDPPDEVFSDNDRVVNSLTATSEPWRLRGNRNRNTISVQVFDQYGDPYGGSGNVIAPEDTVTTADFPVTDGVATNYAVPASGRRTITYSHNGEDPLAQTVAVALEKPLGDPVTALDGSTEVAASVVVEWADRASGSDSVSGSGVAVRVGDPRTNFIVVGADGDAPSAYQYGPDDTFVVEGTPVTLAQFEEVLGSFGTKASDPIEDLGELTWSRYDFNRPRDGASWELSSLSCRASGATR